MPVRLEVFNILGQRVVTLLDQTMDAGTHGIIWDGKSDAGVLAVQRSLSLQTEHTGIGAFPKDGSAEVIGRK